MPQQYPLAAVLTDNCLDCIPWNYHPPLSHNFKLDQNQSLLSGAAFLYLFFAISLGVLIVAEYMMAMATSIQADSPSTSSDSQGQTFTSMYAVPFTVTKGTETFTVREARRDELGDIGWVAAEAFINNAMAYYFSGTTKPMQVTDKSALRSLYEFYYFLFKTCAIGGGRAVVAVSESKTDSDLSKNRIAAAACWYPPGKRIKTMNALRGGIVRCLWNWGFQGFDRMANEYTKITHGTFKRSFDSRAIEIPAASMRKGGGKKISLKESDSWYLQAMFSSKRFEGRGLMATLMREGYAYAHRKAPGIPITLDATSARARDRYMHLGYELMEPVTIIGAGKATPIGLSPSNKTEKRKRQAELTGVPYWCMVNWDPSRLLEIESQERKL
ncbi:hypothetical protein D9757_011710 [Collybiopsis confluens]|uniref:N-acetyltransferase domain-containing protein n=1 Tax=Collybiopsis confluens TaxID=2823264 RepID=A0A8H5GDN6_9AGAR|nr:hypothetical protein D9757_011710 [Collybiopsis confluens]